MDFPYLNPVTENGKELYYPKGRRGFKGGTCGSPYLQ
jgi:hypothetical protein